MSKYIEKAVHAIIRPPRKEYDPDSLPLVLNANDSFNYVRHPVRVQNERGQLIVGSLYHLSDHNPMDGGPCVIYMHGNASSQLEGQFLVPNFCKYGIYVFCFDFVGCGRSDGDYVSLGYYESKDTDYLIDLLHTSFRLGPFILWGRSMGAATIFLTKSPHIIARVSDSAFTSIEDMCSAIAASMNLPSFFVPAVIWFLKGQVFKTAEFDFSTVSPLESAKKLDCPMVLGHAEEDQFIPFEQCRSLYEALPNRMKFISALPGGHNSKRNVDWIHLGVSFVLNCFNISVPDLKVSECRTLQSSEAHFANFATLLDDAREQEKRQPPQPVADTIFAEVASKTIDLQADTLPLKDKKERKKKHKKHPRCYSQETQTQYDFGMPSLRECAAVVTDEEKLLFPQSASDGSDDEDLPEKTGFLNEQISKQEEAYGGAPKKEEQEQAVKDED